MLLSQFFGLSQSLFGCIVQPGRIVQTPHPVSLACLVVSVAPATPARRCSLGPGPCSRLPSFPLLPLASSTSSTPPPLSPSQSLVPFCSFFPCRNAMLPMHAARGLAHYPCIPPFWHVAARLGSLFSSGTVLTIDRGREEQREKARRTAGGRACH